MLAGTVLYLRVTCSRTLTTTGCSWGNSPSSHRESQYCYCCWCWWWWWWWWWWWCWWWWWGSRGTEVKKHHIHGLAHLQFSWGPLWLLSYWELFMCLLRYPPALCVIYTLLFVVHRVATLITHREGSRVVRIDPLHFLAACHQRWPNQALSVLSLSLRFLSVSVVLLTRATLCIVLFYYLCVLSLGCSC